VNTFVRLQPGVAVLRGNVSFAGPTAVASLWQRLSANRLVSLILRSIERQTRWVFTAQPNADLPPALEQQVRTFLAELKQLGALVGREPEQAFFVRTGALHSPGDGHGNVMLTLRIGFAPQKPNEFLVYDFRYHGDRMTAEVVPVRDAERHLG
jgi:phage tail sheath protein FI